MNPMVYALKLLIYLLLVFTFEAGYRGFWLGCAVRHLLHLKVGPFQPRNYRAIRLTYHPID